MTVKIITDSTSDLPPDLAVKLGIEVVPGYIRFGKDTYRDGITISKSEFYRQLQNPALSRAQALQKAQQALLEGKEFNHPVFWSPFLLIGSWL